MGALLEARELSCSRDQDELILSNLNLIVNEGDVIVLRAKSGAGKTTLLKCLAHLNVYGGQVLYRGELPKYYGIPTYRTRILYVPQRPSLLPGTPQEFLSTISLFRSRRLVREDAVDISRLLGIEETLWRRDWSNLSGGEAQRIVLAIAIGLNGAEVLLLDEPTSALDAASSLLVERVLESELHSAESMLKAVLWITHSEEQGQRVGTRFIRISDKTCVEETSFVSTV